MIDTIYVLVMAMYSPFTSDEETFAHHVEAAEGPGYKVTQCHFYVDPIIRQVLINLDKHNRGDGLSSGVTSLDLELMELVVECDEPLRYRYLPWLNQH